MNDDELQPTIVYLDVDDEITSAAARLRGIEAERIVFVLPYGSRLATSRINFRLLAREAASRAKRLEIVAADASARALAGTAGLAVFASVAALEGGGGPDGAPAGSEPQVPPLDATPTQVLTIPRSAEPLPVVGRVRPPIRPRVAAAIALVALLVVGGGGLAAFLYLPSATIVLHPATESIGPLELSVEARTDVASPDPANLVVPAREFGFDLEASETFTTTGKKVTETKATGNVTFENCDPAADGGVTIPAGSPVSTASGIEFQTVASLTIKRAPLFQCRYGSVAVEAAKPGPTGNVAAGAITRILFPHDQITLHVTNTKPTTGGTHEETAQISQQDLDLATAALAQALAEDFDTRIAAAEGVPAGTTLLETTKQLGPTTPSVDPKTLLGQEVATFDLGLTAHGTVVGVDAAPVEALAAARLATRVTPGWQLVEGSTSIDVGRPTVSGESITFAVTAGARQVHLVDGAALLAQVRGLNLPAARALLDDYGAVEITLWPDWVTTVPSDTNRISLTIDTDAAGASPAPSAR